MQRNQSTPVFLEGKYNCPATLENRFVVLFHKFKHVLILLTSSSTLRYLSKGTLKDLQEKTSLYL